MPAQLVQPPIRQSSMPLYDTVRLQSLVAGNTYRLFSAGVGATADGFSPKLNCDCNVPRSGGMPMGSAFRIEEIGVMISNRAREYAPSSTTAVNQAIDWNFIGGNCTLQYQTATIVRNYGTLSMFPGGYGPWGINGGDTAGSGPNFTQFGNGTPASGARFRLSTPILLKDGDNFSWNIQVNRSYTFLDAGEYTDIQVALWGSDFVEVAG